MNKKEVYCNYIMPNVNDPNYLFPYFASKENQTIYIIVPTTSPTALNQLNENFDEIAKCSSEEEILPDFRCKTCSLTIFNYSEFKIHQQSHEKNTQEILKKSMLADRVKNLGNLKYRLKSNISKNITNSTIFNNTKHKSYLDTTMETTNSLLGSEIIRSKILPNSLLEKRNRSSFSNKLVVTFDNSISAPNNNVPTTSNCSKPDEPLNIQNKISDLVLKNISCLKSPKIQMLSKRSDCELPPKLASETRAEISPFKNICQGNSKLDINSKSTTELHLPDIARDGVVIRQTSTMTSNHESKTSSFELTSTYTGLKKPLKANNEKKFIPFFKSHSDSSTSQSQVETLDTKTNLVKSSFIGIASETQVKKDVNKTTGKLRENLPTSQSYKDGINSFPFSSNSKRLTSLKENAKNEAVEYGDNKLLMNQITNKLNSSQAAFKLLGNMNDSIISKDSKCKITTESNNRNKEVDSNSSKISKIRNLKSVKASNSNVSILKPLNEKAKKFKCFYCQKLFNTRYQKRKHLIQHQKTKPPYCVLCKSPFSTVTSYRKHLLMVHCKTKNRRKCNYCNYRCFQNSDLEKHTARRHTRDFKYKCSYCVKGYTTPKELKTHIERKH